MGSHKINVFVLSVPAFYDFCKYWPDDGLLRPKLVTNNNNNNNKYTVLSDGVHIQFIFKDIFLFSLLVDRKSRHWQNIVLFTNQLFLQMMIIGRSFPGFSCC
jgi:hypothetical protein